MMSPRNLLVPVLGFLCLLAPSASARFKNDIALQRPVYTDLSGDSRAGAPGVFSTATGAPVVYFGGTYWNAVSSRWEALQDSMWTFDTGVGSHFDHTAAGVYPFKDPSFHAYMEGWVGDDFTFADLPYFRRSQQCAIDSTYSFWCGILDSEADTLCYAEGQGYGDNWNVCIKQTFNYTVGDSVIIEYEYKNDTELDYDFSFVFSDTTGNEDLVELVAYTGKASGRDTLTLYPGIGLPSQPGPFTIKFCVVTDDGYSDQDGGYKTSCGAFALDSLSISGGGISYFSDFETGEDGWVLIPTPPGPGGDWSRLVHVADLPAPLAGPCDFSDSVMVFEDLDVGGHNIFQNNIAASPWIDLLAAGCEGLLGKFIEMDIYADMPFLNYVYAQFFIKWSPYSGCPFNVSPWFIDQQTHYFGGLPTCTQPGSPGFRTDFTAITDPGVEQVRIAIGIFSACQFFDNCTGLTNSTPWFDNVRFGVYDPSQIGVGDDLPSHSNTLANFSPNPLIGGGSGQIQFTLDQQIQAKIAIFDIKGRLVKTLFDGTGVVGENIVSWDGTDANGRGVANGVYFYHLRAGDYSAGKKVVVLR